MWIPFKMQYQIRRRFSLSARWHRSRLGIPRHAVLDLILKEIVQSARVREHQISIPSGDLLVFRRDHGKLELCLPQQGVLYNIMAANTHRKESCISFLLFKRRASNFALAAAPFNWASAFLYALASRASKSLCCGLISLFKQ